MDRSRKELALPLGRVQALREENGLWLPCSRLVHNATLYAATTIMAQLLRQGNNQDWSLAYGYMEFENNGGAAVSVPDFDLDEGRDYYDELGADVNRDYLRVATLSRLTDVDQDTYPNGTGVEYFVTSSGAEGVYGKPFTAAASSRIYGGALVAAPVPDDPTQDVVHSRFYFSDPADQPIKGAGPIRFSWPLIVPYS